ncbi:MAG TPA: AraC family transcriptional regulator [Burkholderiaceae bacterium]|jgi:hypothetical protein|nr:AraC family transcriptional regulator [Burkholderiaceae bacterium]
MPIASRTLQHAAERPVDGRVAGSYLQPLLEAAAARGVAPDDLARAAGLADGALTPLPDTLAVSAYVRLLDAGAVLANDAHFGLHVGERVKLGTYNVYGLILLSCRDFGQALQQTLRFEALAHDLGRSALSVTDGIAEYRWHSAMPHASRHLAESVFAGIRVFAEWLAGRTLPAVQITFAHDASEELGEYRRIFGGPVTFGAKEHCARFDAALLTWPVPNADPGLYPVLQQHAEQFNCCEKSRALKKRATSWSRYGRRSCATWRRTARVCRRLRGSCGSRSVPCKESWAKSALVSNRCWTGRGTNWQPIT